MADVNKTVEVRYKASTKDLEKGLDDVNKKSKNTFENIGKLAAAAATAFVGTGLAIQQAAQEIADLTNELTDASTKTGLAIDTLAGLRLAAEGSGKAFAELEGGFIKFNQVMAQADLGSKRAVQTFGDMGITIHDTNGNLKDTESLFEEVRVRLGQMADGAKRNNTLMMLFGKTAGPALLQSGAIDNLKEMVEATRTLGVDTTPQAIASAAEFQRQMADLGMVSSGVLQKLIENITGGKNSVNGSLSAISSGVIIFGEIGNSVFGTISRTAQNFGLRLMALFELFKGNTGAAQALQDEINRGNKAWMDQGNLLERIEKKFAALDKLQAKRSAAGRTEAEDDDDKYKFFLKKETEEEKALKKKLALKKEILALDKEIAGFRKQAAGVLDNDFKKLFDNYREDIKRAKEIAMIKDGISEREIDYVREHIMQQREKLSVQEFNTKFNHESVEESIKALHELDVALNVEYNKLISDMNQKRADKEKKTLDELIKKEKERRDTQIAGVESVLSNSISAVDGLRQVMESEGNMTKEQSATLFKIQQGLAISEIAMNTAVGVSSAWAQFGAVPPLAIAASGAIIAAGLAQAAIVTQQQPPKFDTGGMIGNSDPLQPDQRLIRAQTGEAVLDRATVNRLGGEKGVRNLQSGGGGSQVVILNPWKHLDRWNASARRMGTTLGAMTPATGQRGY